MAKQPTAKSGNSRIRFIMLDAEISDGDLGQITSAIQNALKPAATIIQQRLPSHNSSSQPLGSTESNSDLEREVIEPENDADSEDVAPRQSRDARPRKPTSMKVLELDLTSNPSLESYANEHMPKNDTERNLVALAWFKESRPDEVVTANHVYTCYRAMKWPSGIEDFPSILRSLKSQQLVKSVGRGQFEINHLGIARVEKMSPSA